MLYNRYNIYDTVFLSFTGISTHAIQYTVFQSSHLNNCISVSSTVRQYFSVLGLIIHNALQQVPLYFSVINSIADKPLRFTIFKITLSQRKLKETGLCSAEECGDRRFSFSN